MTRTLIGCLLAATLVPAALAHEGHDHRVMGTVSAIHQNHLEVKAAADGKATTVTINEKTRILRGKAVVAREAIKVGERVVVTYAQEKDGAGKDALIAKEIRLGTAGTKSGS